VYWDVELATVGSNLRKDALAFEADSMKEEEKRW